MFPGWQETSPERDKKFGPLLGVTGLLDKGSSDFFFSSWPAIFIPGLESTPKVLKNIE